MVIIRSSGKANRQETGREMGGYSIDIDARTVSFVNVVVRLGPEADEIRKDRRKARFLSKDAFRIQPEPTNPYDTNALRLVASKDGIDLFLGYINADVAAVVAEQWQDEPSLVIGVDDVAYLRNDGMRVSFTMKPGTMSRSEKLLYAAWTGETESGLIEDLNPPQPAKNDTFEFKAYVDPVEDIKTAPDSITPQDGVYDEFWRSLPPEKKKFVHDLYQLWLKVEKGNL